MSGFTKNILQKDAGKLTNKSSHVPTQNSWILFAVFIEMVLASGIWLNAIDKIPNYLGWIISLAGLLTGLFSVIKIKKLQKRKNEIYDRQNGSINNGGKLIPEVIYVRRGRR